MNTPLAARQLDVRLLVAYLADSIWMFPRSVQPGNTITRATATFSHPYYKMWSKIGSFYISEGFAEMSDQEIREVYLKALHLGFTTKGGHKVPAQRLVKVVAKWAECNWRRYETRRDSRRKEGRKWALPVIAVVVAVTTGVAVPTA